MARLGDVGLVITGNTPKTSEPQNYESNDICFVKPSDIIDGTVTYLDKSEFYISEHARAKARILPPKSVLVTCIGIIGKVAINNVECAFNQQINAIIPDDSKCLTEYLAYAIQNKQPEMQDVANAPVVPILNKTQFSDIEINLPSLTEQEEIVEKLNAVSWLIALRIEQLAKLDQLVKSRFIELFGATSADKCSKRIKDYAEVLGGYAFKSDLFCTDAVPVIRISNINNGCVELDYDICFDELFWKQNKKFRAEQNDILMAMSGATTGKAGIYREDMPALINQRVACIRAKDGIAYPTFLFVATQLEWMYDLIQETSAGCAQPNISGKQIENMPVPDATYEQQQQFAAFVEQTDKSKLAIQQSLDKLELLKKSLMQEYFQ